MTQDKTSARLCIPKMYALDAACVGVVEDVRRPTQPTLSVKCCGRVAVRAAGSFNVQTAADVIQGIDHKHCVVRMRGDGYSYQPVAQLSEIQGDASRRALSLPGLKTRVSRAMQ